MGRIFVGREVSRDELSRENFRLGGRFSLGLELSGEFFSGGGFSMGRFFSSRNSPKGNFLWKQSSTGMRGLFPGKKFHRGEGFPD